LIYLLSVIFSFFGFFSVFDFYFFFGGVHFFGFSLFLFVFCGSFFDGLEVSTATQ
jgi:hypothetical protein